MTIFGFANQALHSFHPGKRKLRECILFRKHHRGYSYSSKGRQTSGGFGGYLKSLKWFSIPASVGFAYIAYLQFRHIQEREKRHRQNGSQQTLVLNNWQVDVLKLMPTRVLSRCWGTLSHVKIPIWLRKPLLGAYVSLYDCNMDESMVEDLKLFPTFSDFFKRKLKHGARVIEENSDVVSPVDGRVLHFGEIDSSYNLEQVKGVPYHLVSFLGPKHPFTKRLIKQKQANKIKETKNIVIAEISTDANASSSNNIESQSEGNLLEVDKQNNKENLYYCIIYLAPGDYHWFHSPADWTIEHRRHVPGHLFSVSPSVTKSVQGLFNINERVILNGQWKHGALLMAAVGAYNVGSIHLEFAVEKTLKTNSGKLEKDKYIDRLYGATGFNFQRGEPIGGFDLGSSVVLIFTAKEELMFHIQPGQKIKMGETIAQTKTT